MKTVDGSKYSVHASSILESHDMLEPVAASSSTAASSKVSFARHQSLRLFLHARLKYAILDFFKY